MSEIGKYRPARSIQPGWHIRTLDENGKAGWHEVSLVAETFNPFTGERFVRVACADGVLSSCGRSDEAMTRTTREVRAAEAAQKLTAKGAQSRVGDGR